MFDDPIEWFAWLAFALIAFAAWFIRDKRRGVITSDIDQSRRAIHRAINYWQELQAHDQNKVGVWLDDYIAKLNLQFPGDTDMASVLRRFHHNSSDAKLQILIDNATAIARTAIPMHSEAVGGCSIAALALAELKCRQHPMGSTHHQYALDAQREVFEWLVVLSKPTVGDMIRELAKTDRKFRGLAPRQ